MKYLAQLKIAPKLLLIESEDSQGFVSAYIYKESFQRKTLPPLYQEKLKRPPHYLFTMVDSSFERTLHLVLGGPLLGVKSK